MRKCSSFVGLYIGRLIDRRVGLHIGRLFARHVGLHNHFHYCCHNIQPPLSFHHLHSRLYPYYYTMSQAQASIPPQPRAKALRACLLCSLVQTPADFRKHGCPNCEELMQVRNRSPCLSHLTFTGYTLLGSIDERIYGPHTDVHDDTLRRCHSRNRPGGKLGRSVAASLYVQETLSICKRY